MSERQPLLSHPSKGGFRTLPFIIANEAFERVASLGLLPNMIVYLMGAYGMTLITGSNYVYLWSAATNLTPIVAAFFADSCVGRYHMIGFGSIISFLGTFLLWSTAVVPGASPCDESTSECASPNVFQLILLVSSFAFMSVGAGGIRSCSFPFAADQMIKTDNLTSSNILEKVLNWLTLASGIASVTAMTVVVYIQENFGWKIGYGVPVALMLLSALSFYLASPLYIKLEPRGGSPASFTRVLVAAWRKRHLTFRPEKNDQIYCQRKGSRLTSPTDRLRFLNKACLVINAKEELTPDGTALDPWGLCTVNQVEELKAIIKLIPIMSTGIIVSVSVSQASVLQARSMNRHITKNFEIPAGSFGSFLIISIVLWIVFYDRLLIPLATKIMGKPAQLSARMRMGIGLLLSSLSVAVSAVVESVRREKAIQEGFLDNPNGVVNMSALWLLPHSLISGIAEAFLAVSQTEFYYSECPKSISSVVTNLGTAGMAIANVLSTVLMNTIDSVTSKGGKDSWVASNINKAHIDYCNWLLAGLFLLNFFYFLLCSRAYGRSDAQEMIWENDEEITHD